MTSGEDAEREQGRKADPNTAGSRRIALSLLKRHPSEQGVAKKRPAAAYNTNVFEGILVPYTIDGTEVYA